MSDVVTGMGGGRWIRNPLNPPIAYVAKKYGGSKWRELERFLRFAVVGVSGAVIDLGTLSVLQATIMPPAKSLISPLVQISEFESGVYLVKNLDLNVAVATTIAFILAVVSNFIWTALWVYPDSRTRTFRRQLTLFALISVVGWSGRTLWITLTYQVIGRLVMPLWLPLIHMIDYSYKASLVAQNKLGTLVAQIIAMWFVMIWNFFANRYWTFNDVE